MGEKSADGFDAFVDGSGILDERRQLQRGRIVENGLCILGAGDAGVAEACNERGERGPQKRRQAVDGDAGDKAAGGVEGEQLKGV